MIKTSTKPIGLVVLY